MVVAFNGRERYRLNPQNRCMSTCYNDSSIALSDVIAYLQSEIAKESPKPEDVTKCIFDYMDELNQLT